jgi:hypothetical protein
MLPCPPAHQMLVQAIVHTIPIPAANAQNSRHFVAILNKLTITEEDILVSFDVESLFTRVLDT